MLVIESDGRFDAAEYERQIREGIWIADMDENRFQISGLVGFIFSGFVFIAAGINSGDTLTILGSVVWVLSCLVWIFPLLKPKKN